MAEIRYPELSKHLADSAAESFSPVYLVFGEPYLSRKACQALVDAMIPEKGKQTQCVTAVEPLQPAQVGDLLEELSTLSFFSSRRVGILKNLSLSEKARLRAKETLQQARKARDRGDMEKAAAGFLRLLGRAHLSLEAVHAENLAEALSSEALQEPENGQNLLSETGWLEELIRYCRSQSLPVPRAADEAAMIQHAVERGFPKNHHLIITCDSIGRRTAVYKAVQDRGTVIDCSVSQGARKKDREARRQVAFAQAQEILAESGKTMTQPALQALYDLIGFDLSALSAALDKLISYTGQRRRIEAGDVQAVLRKYREEPIYELTGAISDRNAVAATRLLYELLASGYHYLQVLMAVTNQVRRLLLARSFISSMGGGWEPRMPYNRFKETVLPRIAEHDRALLDTIGAWKPKEGAKEAGGRKKAGSDLVLLRQPNNPYPLYQLFLKTENFSEEELLAAFTKLNQADVALKRSARSPESILQELILSLCGGR
jgi:DNA polymerase-3 subunit delta